MSRMVARRRIVARHGPNKTRFEHDVAATDDVIENIAVDSIQKGPTRALRIV